MKHPAPILLLTRPEAQSQRFASQCHGAIDTPFEVLISPIIAIEHVGAPDLSGLAGVIFTSENAVDAVAERARPIPAYCVGERTALAAARAGFVARAAEGNAESLTALILHAAPRGRLLHLRGEHQTGDLAAELRGHGFDVESTVVYHQPELDLTAEAKACLHDNRHVILPIFSARSAKLLAKSAGAITARVLVVALSEKVADAWKRAYKGSNQPEIHISNQPDAGNMISVISELLAAASVLEGPGQAG